MRASCSSRNRPRHLTIPQARELTLAAPVGLAKVALVVDADDALLDAITEAMPLDMLQLHGHEPPERVAEIRARYGLPVMKAVGVADEGDLADRAGILPRRRSNPASTPSRQRTPPSPAAMA